MKKIIVNSFIIITFSIILVSMLSCSKSNDVITKPIIEIDTLVVTLHDTVFINSTDTILLIDTVSMTDFIRDTVTTFILIRHAKTEGSGSNPNLSTIGIQRAESLKSMLKEVSLSGVYSTNYNRTLQTAQPTANDHNFTINNYDPFGLHSFIDQTLHKHWAETILIVGHSNTTPDLLNILIGDNMYNTLDEAEYDNVFIVTVFEKGRASVVRLKYGK